MSTTHLCFFFVFTDDIEVVFPWNEETWIFQERHNFILDEWEYSRSGTDPGLVLIFNIENAVNQKQRRGTRRDVNEIIICVQRLGFNINKKNIIHDGTTVEINKKLEEGIF